MDLYERHPYDSVGHAVLLTGAYDDLSGNHVLIAYDPNFSSSYAEGYTPATIVIGPDFSSVTGGWYRVCAFDWQSDFSGFDAFKMDGSGERDSWYNAVFAHLKAIITMLKELLSAFTLR